MLIIFVFDYLRKSFKVYNKKDVLINFWTVGRKKKTMGEAAMAQRLKTLTALLWRASAWLPAPTLGAHNYLQL